MIKLFGMPFIVVNKSLFIVVLNYFRLDLSGVGIVFPHLSAFCFDAYMILRGCEYSCSFIENQRLILCHSNRSLREMAIIAVWFHIQLPAFLSSSFQMK